MIPRTMATVIGSLTLVTSLIMPGTADAATAKCGVVTTTGTLCHQTITPNVKARTTPNVKARSITDTAIPAGTVCQWDPYLYLYPPANNDYRADFQAEWCSDNGNYDGWVQSIYVETDCKALWTGYAWWPCTWTGQKGDGKAYFTMAADFTDPNGLRINTWSVGPAIINGYTFFSFTPTKFIVRAPGYIVGANTNFCVQGGGSNPPDGGNWCTGLAHYNLEKVL